MHSTSKLVLVALGALAVGIVVAHAINRPAARQASAVSTPVLPVEVLTPAEREEQILAALDALALPTDRRVASTATALGATDEHVREMTGLEVHALWEEGLAVAQKRRQEPRFLFALGRMALLHGYTAKGEALLQEAAKLGYGAAYDYLADSALARQDLAAAENALRLAVAGGNPDGQRRLDELLAVKFNPAKFRRSQIIEAFHSGQIAALSKDSNSLYWNLIYVQTLASALEDPALRFTSEDRVDELLDFKVSTYAAYRLQTDFPTLVSGLIATEVTPALTAVLQGLQTAKDGKGLVGLIGGAWDARNVLKEFEASQSLVRSDAAADARQMARMFAYGPKEDVLKIYAGMKKFVAIDAIDARTEKFHYVK